MVHCQNQEIDPGTVPSASFRPNLNLTNLTDFEGYCSHFHGDILKNLLGSVYFRDYRTFIFIFIFIVLHILHPQDKNSNNIMCIIM